jgi:hypothetical protein
LTASLAVIAEILQICHRHSHPDLSAVAKARLEEMVQAFEKETPPSHDRGQSQVRQAILELTQTLKTQNAKVVKPTSVLDRTIASILSKRNDLPSDSKIKRSGDLMRCFDKHCEVIGRSFIVLLQEQQRAEGEKDAT